MRAQGLGKVRFQLVAALLLAATGAALAQDADWRPTPGPDVRDDIHRHWVCDYTREGDGVLYLRCDDLARLVDDDPADDAAQQRSPTQFIPVWSVPRTEFKAVDLVQRVLCGREGLCSVSLAGRTGRLHASLL